MDRNGRNKENKQCDYCKSILGTVCHKNMLLCSKHLRQMRVFGRVFDRTIYTPNEFINCGEYSKMILYNKNCQPIKEVKVDTKDVEKIKHFKWGFSSTGYAFCAKLQITLHMFLLGKQQRKEIDHINRDKLDNRRSNLRFASRSLNILNKKELHGVSFYAQNNKWRARIGVNKKSITIGYFDTKEEAIKHRRLAEHLYYGI